MTMASSRYAGDRATKWMHWVARGIGTLAAVFWPLALLASAIGEMIGGEFERSLEGAMLAALVIVAVVGVIIAWRREVIGGAIAVIAGVALCIFAYVTAGFNQGFAMAVSGGPFLLAGALFLASGWRSR